MTVVFEYDTMIIIMEDHRGIQMTDQRQCGVLLPISSLPSKYGIGCFSKSAYEFVDALKEAGQSLWQILPLGPTSYGDSPYQSFSTFAGNPYFISLEDLIGEGVLTKEECDSVDFGSKKTVWTMRKFTKEGPLFCAEHTSAAILTKILHSTDSAKSSLAGLRIMRCLWQ